MSTIDFTWRPVDALYFGPPVSMAAGEVSSGRSLFPPPPMTVQGIVRTRLLATATPTLDLDDWSKEAQDQRADLVGGADSLPGNWQLRGPFPATLGKTIEPWFPTPRFALRRKNTQPGDAPVMAHRIQSTHPGCNDLHPNPSDNGGRWEVGAPELEAEEALGGWVSATNLRWLLMRAGSWTIRGFGHDLPPFVEREPRTGLAIDSVKGSAKDGLLYSVSALRMKPGSGFLGQLDAELPAQLRASALISGMGAAGRGARPVEFGNATGKLDPAWRDLRAGTYLPDRVNDGAQFWLVTIGPARVKDWNSPVTTPLPPGVKCTVRAALLGPALVLGGISMVEADSRPNRTYAPAGSAWLIELSGGDDTARRAALEVLHDRPSIGESDDHCFGFGHTLLGLTKEHEESA